MEDNEQRDGVVRYSSDELIEDLSKLLSDRYWRLNNLYHITDKQGQVVVFKMNDTQKQFYKDMHYMNVILKARQLGMSTFISIFMLDICLFNENQACGIIDKTIDDAKEKLAKIRFAYDRLDRHDSKELNEFMKLYKQKIKADKESALEVEFSNGSSVRCGVSLRGGTFQYLHISEFGYVCNSNPVKAREIMSGAINTVTPGRFIFIESTHEGGKNGYFYDICDRAMKKEPETELDFKFHFFPWYLDKNYRLLNSKQDVNESIREYFSKVEERIGKEISNEAKQWYARKRDTLGEIVYQQYPSTPEECWQASTQGTIYQDMMVWLWNNKRVIDFEFDKELPVYTFWDIGWSDSTAIWAVQFQRNELYFIDHHEDEEQPANHYANIIQQWKEKGYNIIKNFLPHDAGNVEKGSGKTYQSQLVECGLGSTEIIPRTRDVWLGINRLRNLLKGSYFHKTNCLRGLDCLEAYRKRYNEKMGKFENPLHDWTSNSADAARYVAEAMMNNLVSPITGYTPSYRRRINVKRATSPRY